MIIGSIPNDNLYKFQAFAGMIAFFFSITIPLNSTLESVKESIKISTDIAILQVEVASFKREVEHTSKLETLTVETYRRDIKRTTEIEVRLAQIDGARKQHAVSLSYSIVLAIFSLAGSILGLILARDGFRKWYINIQRPADLQAADSVLAIGEKLHAREVANATNQVGDDAATPE